MGKHYAREEAFVRHLAERLRLDLVTPLWNPNSNKFQSGAAGVDEDQAQAAAEELAAFEARFASMESGISHIDGKITAIEGKIAAIEGKFGVLLWAVGINAAATIAILGVLLRHG